MGDRSPASGVIPPSSSPRNAWDRAIEAWLPLLTNETFWRSLVDHSPVGRDPRLPAGTPQVLRAEVAYALVRGCGRQAVEGFAAQHGEVLEALTQFIQIRLDAAQVALAWRRGRSPAAAGPPPPQKGGSTPQGPPLWGSGPPPPPPPAGPRPASRRTPGTCNGP